MAKPTIPVRFIYRSQSMSPLLTIMEHGGIWKKEGIDVRDYRFSPDALPAEEELLDEGIDFIFGNHVTPYMRLAHGHDMVCMAQTENWMHLWVATAPSISSLSMLRNKRVVGLPLILENGKFCGHNDGNRILLLELEGIDTRTVEFIKPETVGNAVEAVRDGKADACFVSPERSARAEAAGLVLHKLPPMPMVHSITYTTTETRLAQDDDLADRLMRVLVDSTHFLKTRKEETLELLKNPVVPWWDGAVENMRKNYDEVAAEFETKPYPRAEALINVHKLSCMVYPEAKTVNPLELWDTSALRRLYNSGYVDNLYGGKQVVTNHIHETLERGECDAC
jgi:ABC-type nitrate/sulfonate/bicarbonate transport system substrate-binding protein